MNTLKFTCFLLLFSFTTISFDQPNNAIKALNFKLQQIGPNAYGVFLQAGNVIMPSERTATGVGQVTLVAPIDFDYSNLENHAGTWVENARVDGPDEAMENAYVSFGFVTDYPKINISSNKEVLLFSFTVSEDLNGTFSLFENEVDPFTAPNSHGSNPGNDIGIIDAGAYDGIQYYTYAGNYEAEGMPAILTNHKDKKSNKRDNTALAGLQPE